MCMTRKYREGSKKRDRCEALWEGKKGRWCWKVVTTRAWGMGYWPPFYGMVMGPYRRGWNTFSSHGGYVFLFKPKEPVLHNMCLLYCGREHGKRWRGRGDRGEAVLVRVWVRRKDVKEFGMQWDVDCARVTKCKFPGDIPLGTQAWR